MHRCILGSGASGSLCGVSWLKFTDVWESCQSNDHSSQTQVMGLAGCAKTAVDCNQLTVCNSPEARDSITEVPWHMLMV
jgi:hypothetical protein